MGFNVDAALKDGYSFDEIADFLGKEKGINVSAARQDGWSSEEIIDQLNYSNKAFAKDLGAAVGRGVIGIAETAQGVNSILEKTSPLSVAGNAMLPEWAKEKRASGEEYVREKLGEAKDWLTSKIHPQTKGELDKPFLQDGASWENISKDGLAGIPGNLIDLAKEGKLFAEGASSLDKIVFSGVESMPVSIVSMAPAGLAARGAYGRSLSGALASGMEQKAAEEVATKAAERTAMVVGGLSEGTAGAGMQFESTRQEVMDMKPEVLAESKAFQAIFDSLPGTMSEHDRFQKAKTEVADRAALQASSIAFLADAGLGALGDRYIGSAAAGKGNILSSAGRGLLQETPTEFGQSALEQFGTNLGVKINADPTRSLAKDVGEQAVGGALSGGLIGAGMGAAFHQSSRQRAESDLGASTNADQAIEAANRLASSVPELDSANSELDSALADYNRLGSDLSVSPANQLTPDESIELAAAKGAIERTGSLDLSQPSPVIAPAAERAAAADTALRTIEANDGVATPAQAAIVDSVFPGRQNYDQVVGTSEQVPTVSNSPIIVENGRAPRETMSFATNPLQSENAAGWERFNAQRSNRNATQIAPQQATTFDVANGASPVAETATKINVGNVIEALKVPAFQRTAEQTIALQKAEQTLPQADMQLLEKAANTPFQMGANDKVRLSALQSIPQVTDNKGVFLQNTETAPAQENTAKLSTERDVTEDLPAAEQIMTFNQMGEGYTLLNQQQMPDGRTLYTYRSDSASANLNPQVTSAQNNPQVVNAQNNPEVVSQTGAAVPEVGTTMPNAGETDGKPTFTILRPDAADFQDTPIVDNGDAVGAESSLISDGVKHAYKIVRSGKLPALSTAVRHLMRLFNLDVAFFASNTLKADGFVRNDNGRRTIYINVNSTMSPVAVAFHEMFHLMRRDNPVAYQAVMNVVRRNLQGDTGNRFRNYYDGMESGPNPNFDLTEAELEEVAADLVGNSATTPAFLSDVIKEISNIAPQGEARSIILRLAAAIEKVVKAALEVIRNAGMQQSFATDKMVNNLEEIRAVIKQALVDYAVQQKESKAKMAMEFTRETSRINLSPSRENTTVTDNDLQLAKGTMVPGATLQTQGAENAAENDTGRIRSVQQDRGGNQPGSVGYGRDQNGQIPSFGNDTGRAGSVRVQGIHYSKQPLTFVDGNRYGSNVSRNNGAEAERIRSAKDRRIAKRGYFYIDTGNGIKPEAGVGSVPHTAYLNNMYDTATGLITAADRNSFESAVLDAGFDGFINRAAGMAVVLDNKQVPVVPSDGTAEVVPAADKTTSVRAELSGIKSLPAGELTRERWGQVIKSTRPDLYEKIEPTGAFNGEERVYKDGLVKFSPRRGGEQFGDFNVKTNKDGTIVVFGSTEEIRALMPEGVVGRPVPGGVAFTTSQAPRAKAALEGRNVAYSRGGQVLDKMPMKNGKYVGAPEKFNTPSKRPHLRKWLRTLADEGAAGRFWYENSGREVLKMVGGDVNEARKFVALLAIYSPQAKVDANTTFALRAWAQYKAGQPISVKTGVMDEKAQNAMDDVDAFWSGEKTGNFFFNLLREIDPNTEGKQGATIDMWMMRAGQYHADAPTTTQYAFMENETNHLAQELGWEPQQVQAAIWVAMKARMENPGVKKRTEATSEKKGWIGFDYPVKNGRPIKTRVVLDPQKHRDNWLKHAIAHDPTTEDTQLAKFDFGDGLKRHLGQLSFEARPGRSTGVLPGIHEADYEKQVEFQAAVQNAFLEEDGSDRLAQLLGLMVDTNDIMLPGVWQGEVSPSSQKLVAMAPAKGTDGKANVDPAQAAALNSYAAIKGLLAYQEGVGWHRPFYAAAKRDSNGLDIDIGRQISPTEVKDLAAALDTWMQENNKGADWNNNFAVISTDYGVRLVNFGVVTNQELQTKILGVAETVLPDATADWFVSSGDMPTNDWKEFPNGQNYIERAGAEGSSDVFGWSRDVLAPRIRSVFQDFSERYGWGNPGSFDFAWPEAGAGSTEEVTSTKSTEQAAKLSPPRFYSQLEQTVAQVPARISIQPAPQWKAWLSANAAKFGIKKDEIEWSGINDYLTLRGKDKVTAAELSEFLDLNNVNIEEVTKGGAPQIDYSEIEELPVPSALRVVPSNDSRFEFMVETVMDGRRVGLGDTEQDALSDAYSGYPEYWEDMNDVDAPKYAQWVLPGGENYREMLLTLPNNNELATREQFTIYDESGEAITQGTWPPSSRTQERIAANQQWRVERKTVLDRNDARSKGVYQSAHWDESNILAHIRLNDRQDIGGNKVLFVEEIQSDWAQAGRKGGIRGELSQEAKARVEELRNQRIELDRQWRESDNPVERRSLMERANEISNKVEEIEGPVRGAVPAAPFVSNTKDWVALAVKRVMLLAAQGDYDKVAFVNGKQSADRYNLAKQIDYIEYEKTDTNEWFVKAIDNTGRSAVTEYGQTPEKLENLLGKEIAQKIVNNEGNGTLLNAELSVGGEGMKSFYNRIVPQVVGDVLKKLGGKMETVDAGNAAEVERVELTAKIRNLPFDSKERTKLTEQLHALDMSYRPLEQPGFTITPEMREKLKGEGLPLFSPSRQSVADAISSVDLKSDIANQVKFKLADIIALGNGFNWFHKTIGTQFHKAKVNPLFKKVFDIGQQFLDDVTLFATRAEDKAMDIFPRFGLTKQLLKMGMSKADNELIGRALADGTLENGADPHTGVVWTDAQLRQKYNMTDKQIGLYRQARAAIDQSLEDLAKSEMGQHMRVALKMSIAPLMRSNMSLKQIRDLLVQTIDQSLENNPGADKSLRNARSKINEIYSTTTNLQRHGYAPLMRFGQWTVTAKSADGEVQFFQMTTTKSEASLMAKSLGDQFDNVEVGKMSQEAFKLFKGISPDTLELFAKHAALDTTDVMQEYLSLAISSRSAMKRLINRKGTSGYSTDATRTLASFITSNARRASTNLNASDMKMAADAIPREQGDVKDEAVNLVTYLQNPGEEAAKLRGFLFFQYLGGSIASGIVNLTQPLLQTYPYLSQFGAVKAGNAMKVGMTAATSFLRGKRVSDPQLQLALERAKAEGLIDPQEIYQLMAASQSGAGSFLSYKFMRVWGLNFAVTELINRALTFSAAFEVGKSMSKQDLGKAGATDAYNFAQNAIYETQGIYNKGNRPDWARGAVGGTVFTFKQFSISYVEFLTRLYKNDKKAFGVALAILIMAAGLQGIPGADDLDDVIDTAGNWMGYATNTKRWKRELLESVMGKDMAAFALHGVSTIPGMPIDIQARLGLGNLIPGTGLMNPTKKDKAREIAEVFGVAGGMAMSTMDTAEALALGDVRRAGLTILPGAVRNLMQAAEMASTGEYRDQRGRKVQDVTTGDVVAKAIGFQPAEIAAGNRRMREVQADIDIVKSKQEEINGKYARAIVDNDQQELTDVRAEIADWNKKNPDLPVKLNMSAIRQRVKQARLTKEARFVKSAPKQIRSQVRESLLAD